LAFSVSSTSRITASGGAAAAVEAAEELHRLVHLQLLGEDGLLQADAHALADGLVVLPPAAAQDDHLAAVGASRPSRISMVVVLPAPFGPRRPKALAGSDFEGSPRTASTVP
jgi:hypothetical protein